MTLILLLACADPAPTWTAEAVLTPTLVRLDADGNGTLDKRELGKVAFHAPPFERIDRDQSGGVDAAELVALVKEQPPSTFFFPPMAAVSGKVDEPGRAGVGAVSEGKDRQGRGGAGSGPGARGPGGPGAGGPGGRIGGLLPSLLGEESRLAVGLGVNEEEESVLVEKDPLGPARRTDPPEPALGPVAEATSLDGAGEASTTEAKVAAEPAKAKDQAGREKEELIRRVLGTLIEEIRAVAPEEPLPTDPDRLAAVRSRSLNSAECRKVLAELEATSTRLGLDFPVSLKAGAVAAFEPEPSQEPAKALPE